LRSSRPHSPTCCSSAFSQPPARSTSHWFLIPVSAILLGVLVLGETLAPRHFAGMALIWIGLAAVDGRPWRALRRRWPG
jgi:drug/metabolite transporter (DMT)-like permease